jgi:hypothetical protein
LNEKIQKILNLKRAEKQIELTQAKSPNLWSKWWDQNKQKKIRENYEIQYKKPLIFKDF